MKFLLFALGAVACILSTARGQGLLDIGFRSDEGPRLPFSLILTSAAGWDSAPAAGSSSGENVGVASNRGESSFWQNSANLHCPLGSALSHCNVDANLSNMWYFDPPPGTREFVTSGGLSLNYVRPPNSRLSYGNALSLTHQTEPNFLSGESITRPTGGQFFGSNRLWLDYKWSTRFSTQTSWNLSGIFYDERSLQAEDHYEHLFSEKLTYTLTQRTAVNFDYRYSFSLYPDNSAAEYDSHYVLFGVNRPLTRFISMSLTAGEEFRSYDGPLGDHDSPYMEASVRYLGLDNTAFQIYFRSGLDDTGSAGRQVSDTQRFGLSATHRFTPRLRMNVSADVVNSGVPVNSLGIQRGNVDTFHASAGLHYSRPLWHRLNLDASYQFSMVASDDPLSEYERHLLSLGVSAQF